MTTMETYKYKKSTQTRARAYLRKLKKRGQMMRLFDSHDAALIDDVRREFDALLFVPLTPRDIKLTFEQAVAKVVLRRSKPSARASQATLAKLSLAMTYMTQEKAFGLDIRFPARLKHLTDIPIDQLTEAECNRLAEAGMKAHRKALGIGK
jgi:hypothetical protein